MYRYQGFWDRIANKYANNPIKDQRTFQTLVEHIRKHVKESDTVLDFGCGTGTYSMAIADKVQTIHAIDISEKMLAIARQRASSHDNNNIHCEHLEIFDSKLRLASYDVVLAFNILHLQQDLDQVVERIKELLVPGGLLISKTVCVKGISSMVPLLMRPFSKLGLLPHVTCMSFEQLQQAIQRHQLTILETLEKVPSTIEYFIVAQK